MTGEVPGKWGVLRRDEVVVGLVWVFFNKTRNLGGDGVMAVVNGQVGGSS
jgi:hypothetical protein